MDSLLLDIVLIGWATIATIGWALERGRRQKWQAFAKSTTNHLGDVKAHLEDVNSFLKKVGK